MKSHDLILEKVDPGIQILKVSRPSVLNALNSAVLKGLKEALSQIAENPQVRVLILTGDGEKSFIAGADIAEMKDLTPGEAVEFAQLGHEVTKLLELMPKPTIAAVNGYALGGGMEMAISCDFIVASKKAIFGQPEVGLGIIPGFGATLRLLKFVGLPLAKELIFSGRKIKADEALQLGLINHLYPEQNFMEETLELAKTISLQSASAVAKSKQLMNEFAESIGLNSKLDAEAHAFGRLFSSHDQIDGMKAFIEKRKPHFKGL